VREIAGMGRNDPPDVNEVLEQMRRALERFEHRPAPPRYRPPSDDPPAWSVRPPGGFEALRKRLQQGSSSTDDDQVADD